MTVTGRHVEGCEEKNAEKPQKLVVDLKMQFFLQFYWRVISALFRMGIGSEILRTARFNCDHVRVCGLIGESSEITVIFPIKIMWRHINTKRP